MTGDYDINLNDKYGQLTVIEIAAEAASRCSKLSSTSRRYLSRSPSSSRTSAVWAIVVATSAG